MISAIPELCRVCFVILHHHSSSALKTILNRNDKIYRIDGHFDVDQMSPTSLQSDFESRRSSE